MKGETETFPVSDYLFNTEGKVTFAMRNLVDAVLTELRSPVMGYICNRPPALMRGEEYNTTFVCSILAKMLNLHLIKEKQSDKSRI